MNNKNSLKRAIRDTHPFVLHLNFIQFWIISRGGHTLIKQPIRVDFSPSSSFSVILFEINILISSLKNLSSSTILITSSMNDFFCINMLFHSLGGFGLDHNLDLFIIFWKSFNSHSCYILLTTCMLNMYISLLLGINTNLNLTKKYPKYISGESFKLKLESLLENPWARNYYIQIIQQKYFISSE